jgi:hypothetical protein
MPEREADAPDSAKPGALGLQLSVDQHGPDGEHELLNALLP